MGHSRINLGHRLMVSQEFAFGLRHEMLHRCFESLVFDELIRLQTRLNDDIHDQMERNIHNRTWEELSST